MSALAQALGRIADGLAEARDELNRLDAAAGDGDLGNTMVIAAGAVRAAIAAYPDADAASLLRRCGTDVAVAAPSTAGTLTARGLLSAAQALAVSAADPPVVRLHLALAAALAAIQAAGKAVPGDKTMIDALAPAVAALGDQAATGASMPEALAAAAAAARSGAAQTADMAPRAGRARWLTERSRGAPDAGAHLVALELELASTDE